MTTTTASLLALALAFAGMGALSFAMDRHCEQLTRWRETPRLQRVLLRGLGSLLIAGALAPCLLAWGGSVGTVAWLGFLSAGALCVALLLPYLPRVAATAAALSAVVGVACLGQSLASLSVF
jgi:hypothetical protein